jgi:hypothetical protein
VLLDECGSKSVGEALSRLMAIALEACPQPRIFGAWYASRIPSRYEMPSCTEAPQGGTAAGVAH